MDITGLLRDYNIPYIAEGHKHCTDGWINVHCPFCPGSQDYHLGIHTEYPVSNCWRCGGHSTVMALSRILNLHHKEVEEIIKKYAGKRGLKREAPEAKVSLNPFKFPQPCDKLNSWGREYLEGRGFDPEKIERVWGLQQTGPVSFLDGIQYNNRIVIPINWNGQTVSFQTRDITDKSDRKYLACPMRREIIHHKNILYGKQKRWGRGRALIIVEGVTDVWRLGGRAVATFGTSFKTEQVLQLSGAGERFFIIFDNEPQAQQQAQKLATKLKVLGKQAHIMTVIGDPGSMKQDDANHLIQGLLGKGDEQ